MPKEKIEFESSTWDSSVISSIPMDGENNVGRPEESES